LTVSRSSLADCPHQWHPELSDVSVFELLRERVPVEEIVGRGSAVRSNKVRCVAPGHADSNPSMHLYGDHIYCFSCGFHGDVTDVWGAMRGISGPVEAALDLAREYGVELPEQDPEARRQAQERREKEDLYYKQAQACHRALERHPRVREWWESRGFGRDWRERFLLGANRDGTAAIIPFWHRGRVQGLIRRKLGGEPKYLYPKAEHFPAGHRPLFIPKSVRGEAFLVEGILDALALAALGEDAVAVGGTSISEPQMKELEKLPGALYELPDADEEGKEAAREWARTLYPRALVCPAEYGEEVAEMRNKDFADLFAAEQEGAKGRLAGLKARAVDGLKLAIESLPNDPSKRRRLRYVRESVIPLILRQLEARSSIALAEPTKSSEVLAALDDISEATKLKVGILKAAVEEEAQRRLMEVRGAARAESRAQADSLSQEAYAPLLESGVLDRYVKEAARIHGVVGDAEPMRLITLVAVGAQIELLPNRKPLGPSVMLIAEPGRGKNYLTDAVVGPLPPDWYLAFESASAASMYYQVESDPDFLTHRFVYPNEAEATDALVEFLRPMLSAGKAVRLTVNNTGPNGANQAQELEARGPITTVIPTVRNKLDEQLQTRLLVAELEDYEGRVKKHAQAFSRLLLPGYAVTDDTETVRKWRAALSSLTEVRRVVFPLDREGFALDNDGVSHGARLWANLLGLMCAHAWLEQHNREIMELPKGERAVVATPDDYEAAYGVFKATSQRTVVNLSETHRKILDAISELQQDDPTADGFPQRAIAEQAGVQQGTVSKHKAFLTMSAKLVRETDHGLTLVSGAEPSWWAGHDLMQGFPSPAQVRSWWEEELSPPGGTGGDDRRNKRNHRNTGNRSSRNETRTADIYAEERHREARDRPESTGIVRRDARNCDSGVVHEDSITESGLSEPKTGDEHEGIPTIPVIPGSRSGENEWPLDDLGAWEEV
jgi:DNA primase